MEHCQLVTYLWYSFLVDYDHGGKVIIGDYCSIGQNVYFVTANHNLELVTTYPFKSLERFYSDKTLDIEDDHTFNLLLGLVMMSGLGIMSRLWLV